MYFYKEFFILTLEICVSIFVIIFGHAIWDNFDNSKHLFAKQYDNIKEVEVLLEDNDKIVLSNNEQDIKPSILYLHNINKNTNIVNLIIKIDKNYNLFKNNTILKIDNNYYDLNNSTIKEDNSFYYIYIDKIKFNGYETKKLNIKILNIKNYLNYEFITQA